MEASMDNIVSARNNQGLNFQIEIDDKQNQITNSKDLFDFG